MKTDLLQMMGLHLQVNMQELRIEALQEAIRFLVPLAEEVRGMRPPEELEEFDDALSYCKKLCKRAKSTKQDRTVAKPKRKRK